MVYNMQYEKFEIHFDFNDALRDGFLRRVFYH